jgi:hypothetical protein
MLVENMNWLSHMSISISDTGTEFPMTNRYPAHSAAPWISYCNQSMTTLKNPFMIIKLSLEGDTVYVRSMP